MTQQEQVKLTEYERKKPVFEWHKALLLQILKECNKIDGLNDTELLPRFAEKLLRELEKKREPKPERIPTLDNRLRELACENRIVRIKGLDGLKHNYHPDVFQAISHEILKRFFSEYDIDEWIARAKEGV